jgi:hypothetical protein
MLGKGLFVLTNAFLDNSHSINHLRQSLPFLCNIQASEEVEVVSGGDAAATRQPGQNSWGEYSSNPLRDVIFYNSRFY